MNTDRSKITALLKEDFLNIDNIPMLMECWMDICTNPTDIKEFEKEEIINKRIKIKTRDNLSFVTICDVKVGRIFQLANGKWNFKFGNYTPALNFTEKALAIEALDTVVEILSALGDLFIESPIKSKFEVIKNSNGDMIGMKMNQ